MNKILLLFICLSIFTKAQNTIIKDSINDIINYDYENNPYYGYEEYIPNDGYLYNPLSEPNTYQNDDNPNYWKNKMPHEGYWQQDIHYIIKAKIDEETDIISANQELIYTNNSPDTLDAVYFHLYQNAFQPDSYLDELQTQNKKNPKYGEYENKKLGTIVESLSVDGENVKLELDNTILKVYLPKKLNPNEKCIFQIQFKTYFDQGDVRRRMTVFNSWGFKHYNGVHWYPRICVYDAKFGWTRDQHLGKEFYGNFGCFEVELDFASNYVVEATGFLKNRNEVLPKELREKLDIKNFANKEWNSPPSIITPYKKGERKIWKFHAENVHDFAFTADPTYRIGEAKWEDKVCYSLVQEPHASKWQNAADFGAECLRIFSEDFGRYIYHKVIVADARSGMEYPMITLDGGSDPGYRDLLAHEIGHMWFFGQVGNNETYRALLDEGFTQFLTAWAMIKIDGEYMIEYDPAKNNIWAQKFKRPFLAIDSEIYYSYINDATKYNDPIISTHSDGFNGALRHENGYRHVYHKTAAMLYNLQYVLGDELFLNAMKNYFETWKIAHPYNEDFRNSIIQYTKVDLNWFFDQWLESTKRIDYSVKIKNNKVSFKRKSRMEMPIDFQVIAKNGKKYNYHIPNKWFIKKTSATILPKWHGWDLIHPEYSVELDIPSGIEKVIIDPTSRLADAYMVDNNSKKNYSIRYNGHIWEYPDWRNYEIKFRPDLWWNNVDGAKIGVNLTGGYLNHHHLFDGTIWINSAILRSEKIIESQSEKLISYKFLYNTNLDNIALNTRLKLNTQMQAGLYSNKISLEKSSQNKKNKITIDLISMYRVDNRYLNHNLNHQNGFSSNLNMMNNRIDIKLDHKYKYIKGSGKININLQSSSLSSDYSYNKVSLTAVNKTKVEKLKINTRFFIQYGAGNNWATESKLMLAGGNYEELMQSKFTNSDGVIPSSIREYNYSLNNFHSGGGLNLRGYTGYLAPEFNEDGTIKSFEYIGTSGISFNTEIDFTNFMPYYFRRKPITSYVFADAGIITSNKLNRNNFLNNYSSLRADAGIGFTYTISNYGPLETINPLVIRVDFPLFLNRPPSTDNNFIKFRWLLGINRAF